MSWVDGLGYVAALFVFATYSMKTMIPLRILGIGSNIFFIAYGYFGSLYPNLILHMVLLPLNGLRLYQMVRLVQQVKDASRGNLSMDWLKSFMTKRSCRAGEVIFQKGDLSSAMFYTVTCGYRLNEIGVDVASPCRMATSTCSRARSTCCARASAWPICGRSSRDRSPSLGNHAIVRMPEDWR